MRTVVDRTSKAHVGAKYFSPAHSWCGGVWWAPRFMAWRCLMVGRLRTDGTRTGEKYFAPTHAVRCYIGARTTIHGVAIVDTRAIADGWRTDGRKIFRPHTCGAWLHWARTTIYGVAMFDSWVIAHGWHTYGRKIFRPYTCGALLHWCGRHDLGCGDV